MAKHHGFLDVFVSPERCMVPSWLYSGWPCRLGDWSKELRVNWQRSISTMVNGSQKNNSKLGGSSALACFGDFLTKCISNALRSRNFRPTPKFVLMVIVEFLMVFPRNCAEEL